MPFKSRAQKEYLRINEPEIYERWMREYDAESNQSFTPPAAAVAAAKKGLAQRKKWGRGGLSPAEAASQGIDSGVTRARKISSGKVSRHDVRRMSAFNRHRKNNNPSKKMPDGGPTAGTIAWNLWGGSAGVNWAKKKSATMNAETFVLGAETGFCPACGETDLMLQYYEDSGDFGCLECGHQWFEKTRMRAEKYYEEDPERYYSSQFEPYDSFPTKDSAEQLYIKTKDFITTWSEGWDDYRRENQENGGYFTSLNAAKKDANKEAKYYARKGYFPFYQSEDSSGINFTCQKSKESVFNANTMVTKKDYTERVEIKYELIEKMGAESFESPVSCKICGKTFDSFRGLNGHMNAHLPSHRKRAEEEEDELKTYQVSVPVLHYYGIGPVEAYDEDEAADEVRNNWRSHWRHTIEDNGDWGGPLWRYSPLTSHEPEAYEIFASETFGDVDPDGQLAQALRAAREKSRYAPQPLRITKLPHPDQKTLKDFEAETKELPFSVSRKDIALVSFGAILGVVSGVIGEVLAEFWLDRYRRDPELVSSGDDENA